MPLGQDGDTYSRYLVRMQEMLQSARIVTQAVAKIQQTEPGDIKCDDPKVSLPPKERVYNEIDALIHHFLLIQDGIRRRWGKFYQCIEAPKGEMGFYIVSDGSNKPFRLKVRGPSFINLSACDKLSGAGCCRI